MQAEVRYSKMIADYIIVGQGIAGSNLALELIERGKKAVIFDNNFKAAACLVAAGVINPITGQRLVKSWRSDVAHPYAKNHYKLLEKKLSAEFYRDRKILQLCKSAEEHELWAKRLQDSVYAQFIGEGSQKPMFTGLNDKFGHHFIERSAWVETSTIMPAFANFFKSLGVLRCEEFDYNAIQFVDEKIQYKDISARGIIFCEGWQVLKNPYFSWLPYRCAKGEILQVRSSAELPEHIIHRGNWIMKCSANEFRIGSTWDRENLNDVSTESARKELLNAIPNIIVEKNDFEVVRHSAGVRPCTATTRPHLGAHPKFRQLFSFNGFGSKGYALSPYFACEFADFLDGKKDVDLEADLKRHIKKFYR